MRSGGALWPHGQGGDQWQASEVRSLISRTEQMERTPSDILEDSKNGVSSSETEGKALVLPMGPDDFL